MLREGRREGGNQSEAGEPASGIIIVNGFECIICDRTSQNELLVGEFHCELRAITTLH